MYAKGVYSASALFTRPNTKCTGTSEGRARPQDENITANITKDPTGQTIPLPALRRTVSTPAPQHAEQDNDQLQENNVEDGRQAQDRRGSQ